MHLSENFSIFLFSSEILGSRWPEIGIQGTNSTNLKLALGRFAVLEALFRSKINLFIGEFSYFS